MKIIRNMLKYIHREIDGLVGRFFSNKKPLHKMHRNRPINPSKEIYKSMCYSKEEHFSFFQLMPMYRNQNPSTCDLKVYQDLFVYSFIKDYLPKGSKILEIGGGESRVIKTLSNDYEFWNLDMLEGAGHGPTEIDLQGNFILVKNNIGNFSKKLQDGFFDLVFSISVIEHFPEEEEKLSQIFADMKRVTKADGYWVHCVDSILFNDHIWIHPMVQKLVNEVGDYDLKKMRENIFSDKNLWVLPKFAYYSRWFLKTQKKYKSFGYPLSINLIFKNV